MRISPLRRESTALVLVDFQERLFAAMPATRERMLKRTRALVEGAVALALPIVVSEQYPKGLGPTLAELGALIPGFAPIEKMRFSAALPAVMMALDGRTQILLAGMETHVCVFQTARDLIAHGRQVVVCSDAVGSRFPEDFQAGLGLCAASGATLGTVESSLFDLLGEAGSPEFKRVSAAVK